jgi:hypothetical protein
MSTIEFEGVTLGGSPSEFLHRLIVGLRNPGATRVVLTLDERVPRLNVEFESAIPEAPPADDEQTA